MDLPVIFSAAAFVGYMLACIAILSRLFHPQGPNQVLILSFGTGAIVLHCLAITQLMFNSDSVNFSLPNVIALVTLIIAMIITLVSLRYKVNLLLPVVYGFAGLWQLLLLVIPSSAGIALTTEKALLISHITVALLAYCILVIATLYAFQVSYINMKLKRKQIAAVSHLPPLMQVEQQLFFILALGTLCLFISEVSGFIFLENFFSKQQAHKTLLSLIALGLYLITLWGHYKQGWRGHRVLLLVNIATLLLTLSYFGSRFVKEFLL